MSTQRLVRFRTASGIYPVLPALPPWLAFTQGNIYFVRPYNGRDENDGKSPDKACRTVRHVHDYLMKANQNDICFLLAESNTGSATTDYLAAQLDWSKDLCHLIGVTSGCSWSPRARIAAQSAYAAAAPIMTVSADGCYFSDFQVFLGVADTTPLGAFSVSGSRNRFDRCHFNGFGAATNDIALAYSLLVTAAEECEFHNCVIGSENIGLGAQANSQIKFAASARRILFKDCRVLTNTNHATNHLYVRAATTTTTGAITFENCSMTNTGATMTYGVSLHASNGRFYFRDCHINATDVSAADETNIFVGIGGVNNTSGLYINVETT